MSFYHTTLSVLTRALSCQRTLVALLVIASLGALSGCVDSENEILLKTPVALACSDLVYPPSFDAKGDLDSSSTYTTLTINLAQLATNGQPVGLDTSASPPTVTYSNVGANTGMTINAILQNTLQPTTTYTSIGALREHRVNQNNVKISKVKLTWKKSDGSDLTGPFEKEVTSTISTGGTATISGVLILDPGDDAIKSLQGEVGTYVTLGIQFEGHLFSGYGIDTTKVEIPVLLTNDPNISSTPMCAPKT